MESDDLYVSLPHLTELDKLELEEILGGRVTVKPEATPSGHLGEPGTVEAIISLAKYAIPSIAAVLSIYLVKGRHRERVIDETFIANASGTFHRKLSISTASEEAVKADVIRELTKASQSLGQKPSEDAGGTTDAG
jgi:hypothetical protein